LPLQNKSAAKPGIPLTKETAGTAQTSRTAKSAKRQTKSKAKQVTSQSAEQEQQVLAEGDLSKACPNSCPNKAVTVIGYNNETKSGTLVGTSDGASMVKFMAPPGFHAAKVLVIGEPAVKADGQKAATGVSVLSVREAAAIKDYRVAVRGDFRGIS